MTDNCQLTPTPDDHSLPVPLLPISNRTVKRQHADDSAHCARESRSLSGTHKAQRPGRRPGRCALQTPPVGRASARRNAAKSLWVGLQPDGVCADAVNCVGLKADPQLRRCVGRASARQLGLQPDGMLQQAVGRASARRDAATGCGSGFSPTGSVPMR